MQTMTAKTRIACACAALALLSACQQGQEVTADSEEAAIEWMSAALQRNPNLEVLATDSDAGIFTVRDKHTGQVHALRIDELAAAPIAQLTASAPPAAAATQAAPSTPAAPAAPATAAAPAATAANAATPSQPQVAAPPAEPAQPPAQDFGYTIERSNGQVKVSGPGVSIVSSGKTGGNADQELRKPPTEPIVCEGRRMLHLDNRDLYVDGDAVTAQGGCELYITNSRVVASGTGVQVHDAVVYISNSDIEGATASFAADSGAKMFVRGSTFRGVSRRGSEATVEDQGGNRWR
jgi:hypothetical protein